MGRRKEKTTIWRVGEENVLIHLFMRHSRWQGNFQVILKPK